MQTRRSFLQQVVGIAALPAFGRAAASAAPRWQIGCYTRPWAQFDYRVALDGIAAAGFKYAGLMTAKSGKLLNLDDTVEQAAALGEEARRRGLTLASAYGGPFPVNRSIAEGVAGLRKLIDNSAACGCPNLLLGGTNEKLHEPYYKIVAECCDYAAAKSVGLTIKPHGGANATSAQCRKIIDQLNHPNFRMTYDPGNIFFYSEGRLDPVQDAPAADGVVVGMCVKDYLPPKNVNVTPGTGQVDFKPVLARLKRGGFTRGPLLVECLSPGDLAQTNAEAVKARQFLERLVRDISTT